MTSAAGRHSGARVRANGVMLNWYQTGKGPDVVTIHGLGANLGFWYFKIIPALSARFRVTAFDLRGHGHSDMPVSGYTTDVMARDLHDLFDALEIRCAHLVGHSFGGSIALHCATLYPERVNTITVADGRIRALQPSQKLSDWPHWQRWKASLDAAGARFDGDQEMDFTLLEELARQALRNPLRASGDAVVFLPFSGWNGGVRNAKAWLRLLDTTQARKELDSTGGLTIEMLRRISHPTLAIYGEYSFCLPTCDGLHEVLQRCEKKIVPEAGHYHPVIKSGFFADSVQSFIGRNGGIRRGSSP